MRKRRLMALAMAAMMMSSTSMISSLAEVQINGETVNTNTSGNLSGTDDDHPVLKVDEGDNFHVKGDVTTDKSNSAAVEADNGTVIVNGNAIASDGAGVDAMNKSDVTVKKDSSYVYADDSKVEVGGNVTSEIGSAIDAVEGAEVTVKGDVSGAWSAIRADNSTVTVEGNVTNNGGGLDIQSGATVTIGGNVNSVGGVTVDGSKVTVKGDLTSEEGSDVTLLDRGESTVTIEGNVKAGADKTIDLDVSYTTEDSELAVAGKIENKDADAIIRVDYNSDKDKVSYLPEIVVGEIEDMNNLSITDLVGDKLPEEKAKEVLDSIKYIVNTKEATNGTIKVTKVNGDALGKDKSGNYNVAKESETLNIHIDVAEGYEVAEVKAGKATATLVKNADGSYSVKVPAGGGVSIEAIMKAIEKADDTTKDDGKKDDNNNSGTVIEIPVTPTRSESHESYSERVDAAEKASTWTLYADHKTYTKANGERARNEWVEIEVDGQKKWFYFGYDYAMETGWKQLNGVWYFLNDGSVAGIPVGGWVEGMTK